MTEFMIYILKVNITLVIMYTFYGIFLRKLSYHKANRIYLLFSLIFSFFLPFMHFDTVCLPSEILFSEGILEEYVYNISTDQHTNISNNVEKSNLVNFLIGGYLIVAILFMFRILFSLMKIRALYRNSKIIHKDNVSYVISDKNISPFSFWNSIFISKSEYGNPDRYTIIEHEKVHCAQRHSIDLLITNVIQACFWYNPVIILYKKSIHLIHEYLADSHLISNGTCIDLYLKTLRSHLSRYNLNGLSSNFNGSAFKQRIEMITISKTKKINALIYVLLIPVISLLITAFSSSNMVYKSDEVPSYPPIRNMDIEKIAVNHNERIKDPFTDKVRYHSGLDIKAEEGTPVFAAGAGKAIIVHEKDGWGNLIIIQHGLEFESYYAHLKSFNIKEMQIVEEGQLIGYVGNTGKSTSPHLHFEIRENGDTVNPNDFIDF